MLTLVDDSPLQVKTHENQLWEPQNHNDEYHGQVPLYSALEHSYNASFVRLGLTLGPDSVFDTLHRSEPYGVCWMRIKSRYSGIR